MDRYNIVLKLVPRNIIQLIIHDTPKSTYEAKTVAYIKSKPHKKGVKIFLMNYLVVKLKKRGILYVGTIRSN